MVMYQPLHITPSLAILQYFLWSFVEFALCHAASFIFAIWLGMAWSKTLNLTKMWVII